MKLACSALVLPAFGCGDVIESRSFDGLSAPLVHSNETVIAERIGEARGMKVCWELADRTESLLDRWSRKRTRSSYRKMRAEFEQLDRCLQSHKRPRDAEGDHACPSL